MFALLADIQDAEPIPRSAAVRMVKEPAGATAVGTRWHESVRVARACWFRIESVVSEVQEPYRLSLASCSRWLTGHLTYDIEQVPGGSIPHQRETVRPPGLLRWLGPVIERRMRPLLERLTDIRQLLERRPWSQVAGYVAAQRTSKGACSLPGAANGEVARGVNRPEVPTMRALGGRVGRS
ncbi:MAG TPA: hypothetical protein VES95_09535 [Dermatophilaceae bacterium]|nr:hypothetical protein [Dermatophilaceae bacterium]